MKRPVHAKRRTVQEMHLAADLTKCKTTIASKDVLETNFNAPTPKTRTDQRVCSLGHVRTDTDEHSARGVSTSLQFDLPGCI